MASTRADTGDRVVSPIARGLLSTFETHLGEVSLDGEVTFSRNEADPFFEAEDFKQLARNRIAPEPAVR